LIQAFFLTIVLKAKSKFKLYFMGLLSMFPLIYAFGVLGDLRMGENVFINSISSEWLSVFEVIPPSLLWFYSYASGGLNNLYYNLDQIEPNFLPFYTFANMIPSIFYDLMGAIKGDPNFILSDGRLTVSTAYQGFISDFGYIGIFIYLPILFLAIICYKYFKAGDLKRGMIYCMLMQTIVMTPYVDTFFYLTFLLQILMAVVVFNRFIIYG
jgi:oligosaccharide repeat unit polymerase